MSVLIKGMEMPFSCFKCPCSGEDNTDDGNEVWVCEASELRQLTVEDKIVHRPEWCPLVPVPPHGDLIDRDDIRKQIPSEELASRFAIENAYVVIPAERS